MPKTCQMGVAGHAFQRTFYDLYRKCLSKPTAASYVFHSLIPRCILYQSFVKCC